MPLRRSTRRSRRDLPAAAFTPILRRAALTCLLTAALLTLASASLFFTTAPAWLSLLVEPFNLIYLPGLFFSMFAEAGHDYATAHVVEATTVFYLVFIYLLLWDRSRRHARRHAPPVPRPTDISV